MVKDGLMSLTVMVKVVPAEHEVVIVKLTTLPEEMPGTLVDP